jgi:hypothetical protein
VGSCCGSISAGWTRGCVSEKWRQAGPGNTVGFIGPIRPKQKYFASVIGLPIRINTSPWKTINTFGTGWGM